MISTDPEEEAARWLLSPQAVRTQAQAFLQMCERGELLHFTYEASKLATTADYVTDTIKANYPDLSIPYHARWRHFVVDNSDRWQNSPAAGTTDPLERARIRIDLAVVSVLLDAGAGDTWRYRDPQTGNEIARSEGLAIASLDAFFAGTFSADPSKPSRADADALTGLDDTQLASAFQAGPDNMLAGLSGRTELMNRLGKALKNNPQFFGRDEPRIGHLADYFLSAARDATLPAARILTTLLEALGDIWPGRLQLAGRNLGDTWQHSLAPGDGMAQGLVPFHKLSQWLSYSLVEPLQELGIQITAPDELTGLAEYRNGGLMIDTGLINLRDKSMMGQLHAPDSETDCGMARTHRCSSRQVGTRDT